MARAVDNNGQVQVGDVHYGEVLSVPQVRHSLPLETSGAPTRTSRQAGKSACCCTAALLKLTWLFQLSSIESNKN